jgi:hypothetical protein
MFNAQVGSEVVPVHVLADVNQSLYAEPGFAMMTGQRSGHEVLREDQCACFEII